ncbi:MAG: hypothetical protein FWD81_05410 [Methanomassiliicoccaceae archaeon]|nr:hypothetical protein [Methanomassiliicoccaceae archaeon]
MDVRDDSLYKVCVGVPEEFLDDMMDSINENMEPAFPGYERAFSYSRSKGTWRPLEGSEPFIGEIGKIETQDEIRLEFVVRGKDLRNVLKAMVNVHPYEEPAMDIVEVYGWRDIV